jgi:hypothetical protein
LDFVFPRQRRRFRAGGHQLATAHTGLRDYHRPQHNLGIASDTSEPRLVRDVGSGLLLLLLGLGLGWVTVQQHRTREPTGETIFDLVGATIPGLKRPMLWASSLFLGLLAVVALIGAVVHFAKATGHTF